MNVRIFFGLVAGLAVLGALGCGTDQTASSAAGSAGTGGDGGSGSAGSSGGSGSGGGLVCPADPADGPVPEACGVWVSATMGDDTNEGTQAKPVKTLTHAIELAAEGQGRVYACAETWFEALKIPQHVSMHGGFDCANGWAYLAADKHLWEYPAVLKAGADQIPMTFVEGVAGKVPLVTDFYVQATSASIPGGSSIGVFVRDDVPLTMRRCQIDTGHGKAGLDGVPGDVMPAPGGVPGYPGANACAAPMSKGGFAPQNACPSGMSKGGAGGDASDMTAANGGDGGPVIGGPTGLEGLGEENAPACINGKAGADGIDGDVGLGGDSTGHLTLEGYVGNAGEDGKPGQPGQGGGGGGATFGKVAVCGAASPGGAAGGSGGTGGCGGKGGGGGKPGGSAIAVAIRAVSYITLLDSVITTVGNGGRGGNGGAPQSGGAGAAPGPGGAGVGSIKPGCAGGAGGKGAKGGWGGGGQGGLSACSVAVGNQSPGRIGMSGCDGGMPGAGGEGTPLTGNGQGAYGTTGDGVPVYF